MGYVAQVPHEKSKRTLIQGTLEAALEYQRQKYLGKSETHGAVHYNKLIREMLCSLTDEEMDQLKIGGVAHRKVENNNWRPASKTSLACSVHVGMDLGSEPDWSPAF